MFRGSGDSGHGGLNGGPASRQAHHLKLQKLMGTEVTDGFDPLEWHGTNHYQMRDSASWCNRHAVHQVPLEIDELTRGRFFVRNSWKIGSRAEAVASLVTNSETSIYILNKWDFMRTMEQFGFGRGSPLSEVLEQVLQLKPQPPPPTATEEPREIHLTMVHGVQKRQRSGRSILTDHSVQNSAVWLRRERLKQGFREGLDPLPSSGPRLPLSSTAPHTHRSASSRNHTANTQRPKSLNSRRAFWCKRIYRSAARCLECPEVDLSSGILSDDLVFSELISNASRRFDDLELPPDPWMSARGEDP
eukprot:gene24864-30304_t